MKTNTKTETLEKRVEYFLFTLSHDSCGEPEVKRHPELYSTVRVTMEQGDLGGTKFVGEHLEDSTDSPMLKQLRDSNCDTDVMKELGLCSNKWDWRSDWMLLTRDQIVHIVRELAPLM